VPAPSTAPPTPARAARPAAGRRPAGALAALLLPLAALALSCGGDSPPAGLPAKLPFAYSRPDVGTPLTDAEVGAFTARVTGFWKQIDYFTWILETCHGTDASTGLPDYLIWWDDVEAVKAGDTVTFRNASRFGGSHNNAEPTALLLAQALAGYLATGDAAMGQVAEQFAKSMTALMRGFVHDADDPLLYLTTRNIITRNHELVLPSGKKKAVDYSDWFFEYEGWNANRYHYPDNPTWGDVWVTTMRSKDDVHAMYRAAAWLPYLAEGAPDESVRAAAAEALQFMRGFARDIVDNGYRIRTKDAAGQPYVPAEDLASFVAYLDLFPDAECDARLATALLATGEPLGIDCGSGQGSGYDQVAASIHYYNYGIIDGFHMAATLLALTTRHPDEAEALLHGLATRIERYRDPASKEPGQTDESWERDVSLLLLEAAAVGLPLTSDEARQVQRFLVQTVAADETFPNWDLWSPSVPDGAYDFRSGFRPATTPATLRASDLAFLLEYCWSPFRNPAGVRFVDCDVVTDPSRWGT